MPAGQNDLPRDWHYYLEKVLAADEQATLELPGWCYRNAASLEKTVDRYVWEILELDFFEGIRKAIEIERVDWNASPTVAKEPGCPRVEFEEYSVWSKVLEWLDRPCAFHYVARSTMRVGCWDLYRLGTPAADRESTTSAS